MRRRRFSLLLLSAPLLAADATGSALRGKLQTGAKPVLILPGGRQVALTGEEDAMKVLADDRLNSADFEVIGKLTADRLTIAGMHQRPLFVYKNNKRLYVSYWCDVCAIRTFAPGKCVCCQKYTDLDLRESIEP
jgi:hypothetical protein